MVAGASMLPFKSSSQAVMAALKPEYYPPALTGLRGSHPGSNEHAHNRALTQQTDWGPTTNLKEEYDLVVVGGGLSGLSAAYFYQQEHGRDKKVLILDNHDDFGGHAKRNEHTIDGWRYTHILWRFSVFGTTEPCARNRTQSVGGHRCRLGPLQNRL